MFMFMQYLIREGILLIPLKQRPGASQLAGSKEDTAAPRDEKSVSTKLSKVYMVLHSEMIYFWLTQI
jgi:hypothetical protein